MCRISEKDNQDKSSNNNQNLADVQQKKLESVKQNLPGSGKNATNCKGHDFVNFCKKIVLNDEDLQTDSDVVGKGLKCSQF